jgi:hypothetical protein
MDAVKEAVSWSSLACRSFEAKLGEIAAKKGSATIEDVIQRLRASRSKGSSETYQVGFDAGPNGLREKQRPKNSNDLSASGINSRIGQRAFWKQKAGRPIGCGPFFSPRRK